jgi:hypothetical protein
MRQNNKLQATRKQPVLSVEEELAELLSDPTLKPSISFLGLREVSAFPKQEPTSGTDSVSDTDTVPDTDTVYRRPRIIFNRQSVSGTDSVSDTGPVSDTDTVPLEASRLSPTGRQKNPAHYNRPKPRQTTSAEEGHSHTEQHVYEVLWSEATAYDRDSRVITIGFGAMSRLMRLSLNNCRLNIRALIRKLAIEEFRSEQCEQKVGKTYKIYNASSIVRRRKTAGLEWVIRTKGVTFVDPNTGEPLEERVVMEQALSGTDSVPDGARLPGTTTGTDSVGDNRY